MIKVDEEHIGTNNSRVCTLSLNSKKLLTPFYFPSITTAETRSDITETIDFIIKTNYQSILVSCYDLYTLDKLGICEIDKISQYHKNGGFVLLDSGEFENFHFHGNWSFNNYSKIIKKTKSDFFMSFDKTTVLETKQDEINKFSDEYIPKSKKISNETNCIAICHGVDQINIRNSVERVLKKQNDIQMIAVPERECGRTIAEYCQTVSKIRQTITGCGKNTILHILGCGNPISITALSYAGADTFDAVDWCRWAIDPKTFEQSSIAHVKLFSCTCSACDAKNIDEKARVWLHNLTFYYYFLKRLRSAIEKKKSIVDFLEGENIDQSVISNLAKLF